MQSPQTRNQSRQSTLTATYEKGFNGEEIEGAPKLAELIADKVAGQDVFSATLLLDNLKYIWRTDRKVIQQKEEAKLRTEICIRGKEDAIWLCPS